MPKVAVVNMSGAAVGEIELSDAVFAAEVNNPAMHQVVRAQLNAMRQGTQSAKTRTEVRGGGKKIYRQKGTGNARHHGRRAPQFTHGGVVFAPKPRSYRFCVPRKIRRLAMRSALTCKVAENELIVLDALTLETAKTKLVAGMLKALGADRKVLLVTDGIDEGVILASRNIEGLKLAHITKINDVVSGTMNVLDILGCDKMIATKDAIKLVEEVYQE